MRMTLNELREMIEAEVRSDILPVSYHIASDDGYKLLKRFAKLFESRGFAFTPAYYDFDDRIIWPVVHRNFDKYMFEYDGSIFINDDAFDWLIIDHNDLDCAMKRYVTATSFLNESHDRAWRSFIDETRACAVVSSLSSAIFTSKSVAK